MPRIVQSMHIEASGRGSGGWNGATLLRVPHSPHFHFHPRRFPARFSLPPLPSFLVATSWYPQAALPICQLPMLLRWFRRLANYPEWPPRIHLASFLIPLPPTNERIQLLESSSFRSRKLSWKFCNSIRSRDCENHYSIRCDVTI